MVEFFHPTAPKAALHALAGMVLWLATQLLSAMALMLPAALAPGIPGYWEVIIRCVLQLVLLFAALGLYCRWALNLSLSDCRMGRPGFPLVWVITAVAMPLAVCGFFFVFVPGRLAVHSLTGSQWADWTAASLLGAGITAGVTEEVVFRGFMLRMLEARFGRTVAAVAPSLAFAALHIINLEELVAADIALLIAAGTSVGILFSVIALHSGSVWPGALVHGVWNLIILGVVDIGEAHGALSPLTYTISTRSLPLTGGGFGVEASLPAICVYWVLIVMGLVLLARSPQRLQRR